MPNRFKKHSVVDMIAKVPMNKGSLLKSIDNLLKTIESSENAVMIPTLLRDKVRVDAWELLFVAKILKASILGHTDLVEFYMNHIGQSAASLSVSGQQQQPMTPVATTPNNLNGFPAPPAADAKLLSPQQISLNNLRQILITGQQQHLQQFQPQQQQQQQAAPDSTTPTTPTTPTATTILSVGNNNNSNSAGSIAAGPLSMSSSSVSSLSSASQSKSSSMSTTTSSWMTANQQQSSSSSTMSTASSTSANGTRHSNGLSNGLQTPVDSTQRDDVQMTLGLPNENGTQTTMPLAPTTPISPNDNQTASRPFGGRQAQPPSLLQLTTTNNHINSVANFNNNGQQQQQQQQQQQSSGSNSSTSGNLSSTATTPTSNFQQQLTLDQLMMQQSPTGNSYANGLSAQQASNNNSNGLLLDGALSISTGVHQLASNINFSTNTIGDISTTSTNVAPSSASVASTTPANATTPSSTANSLPPTRPHELRTSRSAGCLFKNSQTNGNHNNSGASSPKTPTTPYPQAETLANGQSTGLVGDPSAPVRLLLQIEQLKTSIGHVTTLLENVVELYKKSIDQIAQ